VSNPNAQIGQYLEQLRGPDPETAWHALAELGMDALPAAVADLGTAVDGAVRVSLLRLLAEYRSPSSIPAVVSQINDEVPAVWQAALDALVTIGTVQAVAALRAARSVAPTDRRGWIDEALSQIEAEASSAG
jgi:HEAT repeat protein